MFRSLRGPIGALAVASLIVAACGGTAQPGAPTAAPTAQPTTRIGSFDRPIVMAFVPSQDTARVTASGKAIAASLEKATGLKWDVKVPTSYAATIEGVCAGQIDVAWLAPLAYVLAYQKNCAEVMFASLRNDETGKPSTTYQSQILVRADSGINDIKGLKGKKFAYVDPLSASGTLYPIVQIKKETGEDPKTFFSQTVFAGGHDKAVLELYQGRVDGAASFIDIRTSLVATFPDIMTKTKRIATAGPIPNDTVSIRKNFPSETRAQIEKALTDYATTTEGKAALKSLYSIDGIGKVEHSFYAPIVDAAAVAGVNLEAEAAKTARPVATPSPSPAPKTP